MTNYVLTTNKNQEKKMILKLFVIGFMCLIVYFPLTTASAIPNRAKEKSPSSRYKCLKFFWRLFYIARGQQENDESQPTTFDYDVRI